MKGEKVNISVADSFIEMMKNLPLEIKLEIISKLSISAIGNKKVKKRRLQASRGGWVLDEGQTADDLVNEIRAARTPSRDIEAF